MENDWELSCHHPTLPVHITLHYLHYQTVSEGGQQETNRGLYGVVSPDPTADQLYKDQGEYYKDQDGDTGLKETIKMVSFYNYLHLHLEDKLTGLWPMNM